MQILIFFLFFFTWTLQVQFHLGKVLDAAGRKPLPYTNTGILSQNLGRVSDMWGDFSLELKFELLMDTLRFLMIGRG